MRDMVPPSQGAIWTTTLRVAPGARSAKPEVRNPVLGLTSMAALRELDPDCRRALAAVLMDIRAEARENAETSWRKNKGPMAAYWKAVGVYAGHIARAIRPDGGSR